MQPGRFNNLPRKVNDMQKSIFCSKHDVVGLQIRRGDFLLLEDVLQCTLYYNAGKRKSS